MSSTDLLVLGSSPLSLACVHHAATRGRRVTWVRAGEGFARSTVGALLPFPLALGSGSDLAEALRSRGAWLAIAMELETWHRRTGSLLFAFTDEERQRLQDFLEESDEAIVFCEWVEPEDLRARLPVWSGEENALGALFCSAEVVLDPAEFERRVRAHLVEKHGVEEIEGIAVAEGSGRRWTLSDGRVLEAEAVLLDEDALPEGDPRRVPAPVLERGFARTPPQGGSWHLEPIPVLQPSLPLARQVLLVEDANQALLTGAPTPLPPPNSSLLDALDTRARGLHLPTDRIAESWTTTVRQAATLDFERDADEGLTVIHASGEGAFTFAFAHAERILEP